MRTPRVLAVCDDPARDRRAVLHHGACGGHGHHRRRARPPGHPRPAGADRRRADRRPGRAARRRLAQRSAWKASASPPAISSASCGASRGCGTTTAPASSRSSIRSARWLAAHLPQSPPTTIVHGDYRLGNTLFADRAPARLAAILDWEMATLGDPLADIGYLMVHWVQAGDPPTQFTLHSVSELEGFPEPPGDGDPLRAAVGALGPRPRLVPDAGAMEVGRCSWRATTSGPWPAAPTIRGSKTFGEGVVELSQRALNVTRHGL